MKWKYIPPILLILVPYLILFPIVLGSVFTAFIALFPPILESMYIPVLLFGVFPATLILNLLCAGVCKWDTAALARWNLRIKLFLIPVYLFVLVLAVGVPLAVPFLFLFDAVLILASSAYGIRATFRAKNEETIGSPLWGVLFVCHLCFVADVVAAFILRRNLAEE